MVISLRQVETGLLQDGETDRKFLRDMLKPCYKRGGLRLWTCFEVMVTTYSRSVAKTMTESRARFIE